jgi:hypothetical protein
MVAFCSDQYLFVEIFHGQHVPPVEHFFRYFLNAHLSLLGLHLGLHEVGIDNRSKVV